MWTRIKAEEEHFLYDYPTSAEGAVNMIWRQLAKKLPRV
jgi:hypothetical protein